MNTGTNPGYLLALFINSMPVIWVTIAIGLTAAISSLIKKIGEKKRWRLIADKTIGQENESLRTENKELKKQHTADKKAVEEKDSIIARTAAIMQETQCNMKGGLEICKTGRIE